MNPKYVLLQRADFAVSAFRAAGLDLDKEIAAKNIGVLKERIAGQSAATAASIAAFKARMVAKAEAEAASPAPVPPSPTPKPATPAPASRALSKHAALEQAANLSFKKHYVRNHQPAAK